MKKLFFFILYTFLLNPDTAMAQYEYDQSERAAFPWPESVTCAVSLTFDDARLSQIDKGIPLLNQYNVKATFYISPERFLERLDGWKQTVSDGHEIGNHSMSHPCTGNYAFSRDNALEDYNLDRMARELDEANRFIKNHLEIQVYSYAYPCGQKFVGRGLDVQSYVPLVAGRFLTGRGWLDESANDPWLCDFSQLMAMESDGKSFDDLKSLLDNAAAEGGWLILAGHEMDEEGRQTTLLSSIVELCEYVQDSESGIWIDTVHAIATYIRDHRDQTPEAP